MINVGNDETYERIFDDEELRIKKHLINGAHMLLLTNGEFQS